MKKKYLVTGATGFLGKALTKELLSLGHEVFCISRKEDGELIKLGAKFFCADISIGLPQNINEILKEVDTVFHTAAKVAMWGNYVEFYRTNLLGTLLILKAAKSAGVKKFVYTSSPSVIADGKDLKGIDESYPYPANFKAYYPRTKSFAEREVLSYNSNDFWTLALRPHLIFGEGDTNLTPTIINRAKEGKLKKIGSGRNIVDFTYIKDCVSAHIKASQALGTNPNSRGRAYFISQGDPVPMWEWIDKLLKLNGVPPVTKTVNKNVAMFAATIAEAFAHLFRLKDLKLTRFLVSEMATDHYFSIEAAKKELGYQPTVGAMEALDLVYGMQVPVSANSSVALA